MVTAVTTGTMVSKVAVVTMVGTGARLSEEHLPGCPR
jgi:hypothetical protein